jgi:hypothetical protein
MATPIPDPEHVSWLQAIIGYLAGMLTLIGAKLFKRTETDMEQSGKETKAHIKESDTRYAHIETRVAVLEDRKLVTMPELRLAITEALDQAKKLFTPQHEEIEKSFLLAIADSEKRSAELVQHCNTALRADIGATTKSLERILRAVMGKRKKQTESGRRNIKRR